MTRLRSVVAALACSLLFIASCSAEEVLPPPDCFGGDTALLVAQSVPSAELVPCFEELPAGWEVDTVRIDQDGTVVRFDSDRAGLGAARFHYTRSCDISEAVSAPSEQEGAERFDAIERIDPSFRAERFYVFTGGCIRWEFDFDEGASAALSIELGDRLDTFTRQALNDSIRETFIDEEV